MIGPNPPSDPVHLLCTRPYRSPVTAASVWFCSACSETRSSPGSRLVSRCWPGGLSPRPTGISGD